MTASIEDQSEKSVSLIEKYHSETRRYNGELLTKHLNRLANSFIEKNFGIEFAIIARLHEIVDRNHVSLEGLEEEGFSTTIISAIEAITRKKDEPYKDFILRTTSNSAARAVKIFDLKDNLNEDYILMRNFKDWQRAKKHYLSLLFLQGIITKNNYFDWRF